MRLAVLLFTMLSWSCSAPVPCVRSCAGCCDASGVCQAGTSDSACGAGGASCRSCLGLSCLAQVCGGAGGGVASGGGSGTGGGASGGGGGGAGGAGGGGVTGGGAGGGGDPDGGTRDAGVPPTVSLTIGSCDPVTPCEGDLVGTWFYTAACLDDPLADLHTLCAGLSATKLTGTTSGRIDFSDSLFTRQLSTAFSATVNVPASCVVGSCTTVQVALQQKLSRVSCADAATGGCVCSVAGTTTTSEAGTWTVAAGQLTVNTPNGDEFFETCVMTGIAPTTLRLRETASPAATQLGTSTLLKK